VELICPDCRGELQPSAGKMVVCPLHGGEYEVLFDRASATAAAMAPAPLADAQTPAATPAGAAVCAAHPRQPALFYCNSCGKPLCATCDFAVGGGHHCSDCAVGQALETTKSCPACGIANPAEAPKCYACDHSFGLLSGLASPMPRPHPNLPADLKCAQHPEVPAVQRCKVCRRGICATCDFTFAGNVHVCPTCVDEQSAAGIRPERKRKMIAALALALFVTLLMAFVFSGLAYRAFGVDGSNEVVNGLLGMVLLISSIVGTSMAFSAYDKRLQNPLGIHVALWWSSVLLLAYLVLCVIGVMSG
jgi:hypothetical protein